MENSRIAGAKRRLVVAKRLTAAVATVAFGATFVAIRSGAATPNTAPTSTTSTVDDSQTTPSSRQSFFGSSSVGSSSGATPSVSSSTS